jgi:hypothetical protein
MLPAGSLEAEELCFQATGWQHCGCIIPQAVTQSSAPEDGRDHRPKRGELIGIINKPLLLHLVGVYIIHVVLFVDTSYFLLITIYFKNFQILTKCILCIWSLCFPATGGFKYCVS